MKKVLSIISMGFFVFIITLFFGHSAFAEGTSISNGTPITAKISKDTVHTYKFTTNQKGEVRIVLDKAKSGFSIKLVDIYGNVVDSDYFSYAGGTSVLNENLEKGTYYIYITPYNWNDTTSVPYQLRATYPSSFTRNSTTLEPNDTAQTSMNMSNGKVYNSTAEGSLDRDVYQFTTNKDGEVRIALDKTKAGFSIQLVDIYGNVVDSDYFSYAGGTSVLNENLEKGTYYIYITSYNWSGTTNIPYQLRVTYPSSFTRNAATLEPNDTAETSMQMISNKSYSSSLYSNVDKDVYRFTTNNDGNAIITMDQTTAGYDLKLIDSYGNVIDSGYSSYAGGTSVLNENLEKGTYYISITPYNWNSTTSSTYRVKASFIDKTPSVDPIYDTGTTLTGSAVSNTKVYAYVGSVKLGETTAKSGKYSINIPKQKAGTTIGVYTVDTAGNRSTTKNTKVINATTKAVSADYNKIKVSWYSVPGANGYEIYRSTSSSGTYSKIGTVTSGSTLSYINSNVTTGTTYFYKVRAYRTVNGTKKYSPYTKYTSGKAIPATPASAKVSRVNSTSLKLTWKKVSGASGYEIYRATSKSGTYSLLKSTTSLSYTNSKLTKGKTYYYKLRAYRTVGSKKIYSGWTTIISAKP